MNQNIVYAGPDVDDVRYHGSALDKRTGEALDFRCRPTLKSLVRQLEKVQAYFGGIQLQLWYEASYVGFSLQRDLKDRGFDCAYQLRQRTRHLLRVRRVMSKVNRNRFFQRQATAVYLGSRGSAG